MDWLPASMIAIISLENLLSLLLTVIFAQKYRVTKIKAVLALTLFFTVDTFAGVIELGVLVSNPDDLVRLFIDDNQLFPIIFSALGIIGAGIFLVFIDYYESERLPASHIMVIFTIFSSFVTYSFVKLYHIGIGSNFIIPSVTGTPISFEFLPAIMITYLIIVSYPKLQGIRKKTTDKRKARSLQGLMISLFLLFVIPAIFITIGNVGEFDTNTTVILTTFIPRIGVLGGNVILLLTYGKASPAFLHNQQIEKLLVITRSGTPVYSIEFMESDLENKTDDVLISGSLAALSGLLAETISVSDLESIEFKEKEVLIEHQEKVGFFLITDRPSAFVWNALKSTVTRVTNRLESGNGRSMNEMLVDNQLDTEVKHIFGVE